MKRRFVSLVFLVVLLVAQLPAFLFDFVPSVYATTATFGYTSTGGAGTTSIENTAVGSEFTVSEDGAAVSITAYLTPASLYMANCKAAIYFANNTLLGSGTAATSVSEVADWYTFTWASGPALSAGTAYILVVDGTSGTGTCVLSYATNDTVDQGHTDSQTYSGFPEATLVPTHVARKYSIYCTYTPSGDTVKPNPSNVGRDTSYIVGSSCSFYTKWTDDVGLATTGGWMFESNASGTPTNSSWTAFTANPDWSNASAILANGVNAWCFYANDTSNNWNGTGMQYLSISWNYRLSHVINNSTGAGTNYQVYFNVYRGIGTSTEDRVYLQNNNASTFPNDIMFTDNDAVTALHFWVQSYNSSWAGVWVEVADDLSSVNQTIYVYFGKADVTSASNFDNTFLGGDPFDNATLNTTRWTSVDGNPTYTINATGHYLEVTDMDVNWDNGKGFHGKTFTFPASYMIQDAYSDLGLTMYHDSTDAADYFGAYFGVEHHVWTSYDSGIAFASIIDVWTTSIGVHKDMGVGDSVDYDSTPVMPPIPYQIRVKIWKVSGNIVITDDGTTRVDEANSQTPDRIELGIQRNQSCTFGTERFYAFIVRKYVSPEPSNGEWEADSPIANFASLINLVDWSESIETVYLGTVLGQTDMTDLQNVIAASESWQDVLLWSAITLKYGIENETKIKWALNNSTMVAGLPDSLDESYFRVRDGGLLYGYYWADKYSYLQSKWNTTGAFNNFSDAYDYTGHGFLWYMSPTDTYVYQDNPRYLDECALTLNCFIVFYDVCNVTEALTYAETEWEYLNNNLWYAGGAYGDPHFAYKETDLGWECSGGAFLQIIGWLKYCSPSVGNISRLITDMSNRFIVDKWLSPQWCYGSTPYPAIVIHHQGTNPQRRLSSTVTAWSSLFAMYLLFNDTEIENFQDELNGYDAYPPAWKCLYNETADLYDPSTGMFAGASSESPSNAATALATVLQFFMCITPVNASLAVPVESLEYEYLYNMFDSQIFNISLTNRKVVIGIGQAGALNFTFNRPVTQMFNSVGLYELTFDSNWDEITNCTKIGGLPERRYLEIVTKLVVGWNVNNAWNLDVDKTLEQICASLQYIGIGSTIIIKDNSTEYRYDYGLEPNATILILVTSDELRIYCITGGYWYHDYSNFLFRKDSVSQSVSVSLGSSKSASFGKASSQSFSIGFATWGIGEFFRSVSQTITATLNVQRLIEVFRVASQAVALALQAVGAKITVYLVDAILTITTSFQASRLAEWLKTVTQAIAMIFESLRLGQWFRSANQSITASLATNRLIDIVRTTSLLLGISIVTTKLTQFVRASSQTFSFGFVTASLADFFRTVNQAITATLNAQRLIEVSKQVSQAITFSLQAIGERVGIYARNAVLTITLTLGGSRLAEWFKASSQTISITLGSARLAEFIRSASQTIALAFSSVGEKLGNYFTNVALTITTTFQNSRLAEWIRQASQTLTLSLSTSRIAEFLALVTLTIMATVNADRLMLFVRQSSQTLSLIFNGERLIEVSRSVSQTITLTLVGFGEFVGDYFRNAVLDVGFTFATLAEVPEATILLALAIALIVVACVVTYAVAKAVGKD